MKVEDTLPWYRQFWPWFIMSFPAATVVAGFFTLWLAVQSSDSLVVDSRDGIDVITARHAAAELEATRIGMAAAFNVDLETGAVTLELRSEKGFDRDRNLRLEVIHPTHSKLDTTISLAPAIAASDGTATWAGHFVELPTGRRYLVLAADDDWRLSHEWSGQPQFAMTADSTDNGTH